MAAIRGGLHCDEVWHVFVWSDWQKGVQSISIGGLVKHLRTVPAGVGGDFHYSARL